MTTQTFSLDLIPKGIPPIVHVSQYDKGQTWTINITKDGSPFSVPEGAVVTIQGTKADGTGFQYTCTSSGSVVTAIEEQQMTVFAGDVAVEIRITKDNAIIGSLNFILRVEQTALADDVVISETDLPLIEQALEDLPLVEEYKEDAEAYAVGTRNGVPVTSGDPAYQHNCAYYADNFIGMITDAQWASIVSILQ